MMKKCSMLITGLLIAASTIITVLPVTALAVTVGNVYDEAELLSESEVTSLNGEIDSLSEKTGWNVLVATTDDADGKTTEVYADDIYDETFGINTDGVAFLIDMDNRSYYISTSGEAIKYLTDTRIDKILDAAYDEISDGDYEGTFSSLIDGTDNAYEKGIPSNQNTYDRETGERSYFHSRLRLTLAELITAVIAALAACGITVAAIMAKYRLKWGTYHYDYHANSHVDITNRRDDFVNELVTHHRIQTDNNGGGTSTTHTSSGGGSHGGGGRSF